MTEPGPVSQRYAWMIVGLLWPACLINYIDRQVVFSIFPALRRDIGFTTTQLGLIGAVFIWLYSFSSLFLGRVTDLFRRDRLIIASLLMWSAASLGTGMSSSVGAVLFWRGIMGVVEAMYLPAALAVIGVLHPHRTRSRALSLHCTAQMTGIVVGGWGGGWLADHIGWRSTFALLSLAGVAYAPVLFLGLRGLPRPSDKTVVTPVPYRIVRSRCYLALALAFSAFCLMLWMIYAWFPNFLFQRFRLSLAESGLTATMYLQTSTIIGVLGLGALADWAATRLPGARFYIVALGILLSAPFAYLSFRLSSLASVKLASAGFGFFAGGLHANLASAAYDVIHQRDYGIGVGALNMIGGAGILFAGIWSQAIGIPAMMGWAALISAIATAFLVVVTARYFREEHRSAQTANYPVLRRQNSTGSTNL
jgi:predicted MFS family arabinose efflux permease